MFVVLCRVVYVPFIASQKGITAATIGSFMLATVDIISQGCLTQGKNKSLSYHLARRSQS